VNVVGFQRVKLAVERKLYSDTGWRWYGNHGVRLHAKARPQNCVWPTLINVHNTTFHDTQMGKAAPEFFLFAGFVEVMDSQ